ncbi:hypothetical protein V6N13_055694 [Hibiscus sabdariffa]
MERWEEYNEPILTFSTTSLRAKVLPDHMRMTKDTSDHMSTQLTRSLRELCTPKARSGQWRYYSNTRKLKNSEKNLKQITELLEIEWERMRWDEILN